MTLRPLAFMASLLLCLPMFGTPQDTSEDTSTVEMDPATLDSLVQAFSDSINARYTFVTGKVDLADGVASLNVPEGFKFLDGAQSREVIVDLWENPPGAAESVLGMIFPANSTVLDHAYAFVVEYEAMGYVSDADADDINYDELLITMKEDDLAENQQRKEAGYGTLDLIGWAAPPYYDKDRKVLHWAKELHAEEADGNTLNYNVRVLGRKGVLVLNAVAGMEALEEVKTNIPAVLDMASFNPGYTYEEFDSNVDEVAAWTVGGLVAGKVLAKAGILALILKNIKLVFIALAAAGAGIWRFVSGRRKKEEPPAPQA
jgi:uncharacterized membrane-anchored protein